MIMNNSIDMRDSMYPSCAHMLESGSYIGPEHTKWSSVYGYCFGDVELDLGGKTHKFEEGQYFSFFVGDKDHAFRTKDKVLIIYKLGYKCQDTIGWVEEQGRLSYIDGCTDSLLIYPPRMGDPSLNLLHFPTGIEQTAHIHPSIRIGCVISGQGWSDVWNKGEMHSNKLEPGMIFCLEENELHRFRTADNNLTVVAWHPDGDWGPTDHNHTMLNRTYVNK